METKYRKPDWSIHSPTGDLVVVAYESENSTSQISFVKFKLFKQGKAVRELGEAHLIISTKRYLRRMKEANLVGPVNKIVINNMKDIPDYKEVKILEIIKLKKGSRGKGLAKTFLDGIEQYNSQPTFLYCHAFDDNKETTEQDNLLLQMKYHRLGFNLIDKTCVMWRDKSDV